MLIKDLPNIINVKTSNILNPETEITAICYDSRKVVPGAVFVAVRGYKTDGHEYIPTAIEKGASVIVSEEELDGNISHVVVGDCRKALAVLSAEWFGNPSENLTIIGVTGTNGKTTTTYLLKFILDKLSGEKTGLIGTNQIIIGDKAVTSERTTPESYELQSLFAQMRDAGCKYVVMEVSSHALVLDRVYSCNFDIGIFTNLTQDHLDFHKTMENYLKAKMKLFDICKTGIINADDASSEKILSETSCKKFVYSTVKHDADIYAGHINLASDKSMYRAVYNGEETDVCIPIPGMFSVYNSLAAISAAVVLGFGLPQIAEVLQYCSGVRGRAEVVMKGDFTVMVDYAHTPDGVENILKSVKDFTLGRLICVFGCGGDRDHSKRPIMGNIVSSLADVTIVTSDNPRTEQPNDIIAQILEGIDKDKFPPIILPDRREAIRYALQIAHEKDCVLILGKGHETYQEINGHRGHFDDREEVLMFLKTQM